MAIYKRGMTRPSGLELDSIVYAVKADAERATQAMLPVSGSGASLPGLDVILHQHKLECIGRGTRKRACVYW
jgi:hypothetical protein